MGLAGKVVIVTGSSRGIGKGLAIDLAREGANVVVVGRTESPEQSPSPGTITETLQEIKALKAGDAIAVRCDVTKEDQVANLLKRTLDAFGRIDALVNNAGNSSNPGNIMDIPIERWYDVMDLNINAVFICCKLALPQMIAQGRGSIINVSSGAARSTNPRVATYSTAKVAMEHLTQSLAEEVKEHDIAVNAYRPGFVKTALAEYLFPNETDWSRWDDIYACSPSISWLIKQTAANFTGQIVDRSGFGETWGPIG